MKRIGWLIVANCICSLAYGQENWDTYMAKYGAKPGSVLVDMGAMSSAPNKKLPYLVVTGPRSNNCSASQSIPPAADIANLEDILTATDNFLAGITAKKLVGTFTYNCERLNYYYVRDTNGVRNAIARMYGNNYKGYQYTVKIKHDPYWSTYRTFLYPDSNATAWMAANRKLEELSKGGDDLDAPREIKHTLYFMTDSSRAAFVTFAQAHGYRSVSMQKAESDILAYEVVVGRSSKVQIDTIAAMETELKEAAQPLKGYYKGWDARK